MGCGGSTPSDPPPSTESSTLVSSGYVAHRVQEKKTPGLENYGVGACTLAGAEGAHPKANQDAGVVCWPFNGTHNQALLCVCDGHGHESERISEWAVTTLPRRLQALRAELATQPAQTLTEVFVNVDKDLLNKPSSESSLGDIAQAAGTTASVAFLDGSILYVAATGDSRVVLGRYAADDDTSSKLSAIDLSVEHRPSDKAEKARIEQAGGVVTPARKARPARVWVDGKGGMSMSRSLGDGVTKGGGAVIPDPEIQGLVLQPCPLDRGGGTRDHARGDWCLILASDGIWDEVSSQEAVDAVASHMDDHPHATGNDAAAALAKLAEQRWRGEKGHAKYRDDITCIVAFPAAFLARQDGDEEPAIATALPDASAAAAASTHEQASRAALSDDIAAIELELEALEADLGLSDEYDSMGVKELIERLRSRGISHEGCVEREELVDLLVEADLSMMS